LADSFCRLSTIAAAAAFGPLSPPPTQPSPQNATLLAPEPQLTSAAAPQAKVRHYISDSAITALEEYKGQLKTRFGDADTVRDSDEDLGDLSEELGITEPVKKKRTRRLRGRVKEAAKCMAKAHTK
jgi:hypothetical protein